MKVLQPPYRNRISGVTLDASFLPVLALQLHLLQASTMQMAAPVCLIENGRSGLHIRPEALQLLSKIRKPVVVVSIVGLYRTGKSYLMNKLAGKNSGFSLGSTVQANTKGIWMWCVPYPERPHQTLVLLDTEGLGDVQKGNSQNDSWIFALAVLLSSTLVYNSLGTIDQTAMDKLHFVTELSEHIKTKTSSIHGDTEDTSEFVGFFPTFVWAVRDFTLQLERNGQPITEDDYLEQALELKKGNSQEEQMFNLPRKCIRLFFPTRKCFIFDRPTSRKNLPHLEKMQESQLDTDFVEQAKQFCRYIYWTSQEKTLPGGHVVTGNLLAELVKTYMDAICSGKVPCLENAVLALAEIENTAAVREAGAHYMQLMEQKLELPTETLQDLLDIHKICEKEALQMFMARAFRDDTRQFQGELVKTLDSKKEEYCRRNELKSSEVCLAVLRSLSEGLEQKIKNGAYSRPGGHQEFVNDLKEVEERYHGTPKKGIMAENTLKEFLQSKESISKTILQSDTTLTEKEKEMADAMVKTKAAELEQEVQKQQIAMLEQKLEDQRQSYDMNLQELKEKMDNERRNLLEEQEKMISSKLREQEAFLKEGFQKEASQLSGEIQELKKKKEEVQKPSWFTSAFEILGDVVSVALPGLVGKAVGAVTRWLKRL
ncbi:guanylate-binding protein 1-like [Candoia aspera]|uniref:guanylate-binding protein 1-like n=1 Tax=Candoia aspera TaxID=51853 RepID=UPI002FD7DE99